MVALAAAHASTSAIIAAGILDVTCGSFPVAGRPRLFLGDTFIDFFIDLGVTQNQAEGKLGTSALALTRAIRSSNSIQADSVHSTPPTNTPIDERTIERLNYFLRLEPDMNRLRIECVRSRHAVGSATE